MTFEFIHYSQETIEIVTKYLNKIVLYLKMATNACKNPNFYSQIQKHYKIYGKIVKHYSCKFEPCKILYLKVFLYSRAR